MKIAEVKKKYPSQWILGRIVKRNKEDQPVELKILAHSKDREETYEALKGTKAKNLAHFFTGPIPKKGYAVAFQWLATYRSRRGSMGSWA